MFPGRVTTGIAVMHEPDIACDMLLQNHDVAGSHRRHAGRRGSSREPAPIGRKVQFGNDPTKFVQRCLASAECVRASCRTTSDDSGVGANVIWD